MADHISVEEALSRGRKTTVYVGLAIGLAGLVVIFVLAVWLDRIWLLALILPVMFIVSWLNWSIAVTRWKVWAFERVRNVHELKRRAIREKLIWPDDSWFNKTEIWRPADRRKWGMLQAKFQRPDVFVPEDDPALPSETIICFSKGLGYVLAMFRETTNCEPQIVISDKGIFLKSSGFFAWADVAEDGVEYKWSSSRTLSYLTFNHAGGTERMLINDLDTTPKALRKLLKIYRSRSMQRP